MVGIQYTGDREGRLLFICTRGEFVSDRDSFPLVLNAGFRIRFLSNTRDSQEQWPNSIHVGLRIRSYRTHATVRNDGQIVYVFGSLYDRILYVFGITGYMITLEIF